MICFYHNDADGRCAAAIVAMAEKHGFLKDRMGDDVIVEYEEMDYKKPCPFGKIAADELVVIVDFSFKPDVMEKILDLTENIIWIDHHKTAKDYPYVSDDRVGGVYDFSEPGKSGALLAWEYFYPGIPTPYSVCLVSDYDTWQHAMPGDKQFNLGLMAKAWCLDPRATEWGDLFSDREYANRLIEDGTVIESFRNSKCEDYCRMYGYETQIGGFRAFAVNLYTFGSHTFGERMKEYDICIGYVFDGEAYTISLYSERGIDTSVISKGYGGGGHSGASGFVCEELPFERTQK